MGIRLALERVERDEMRPVRPTNRRQGVIALLAGGLLSAACVGGSEAAAPSPDDAAETDLVVRGVRVAGADVDLRIEDGRIAALTPAAADATRWVVPAFVDAHVHLAYDPRPEALLDGGIVAAVDLAAPERALRADYGHLRVIGSGPMLTAAGGYPTNGWGHDGYGRFVDREDAADAVTQLHAEGAKVIKVPLAGRPFLDDETMRRIIARAHELDMRVFVHALGQAEARRAAILGFDVLAHTPVEALSDEIIALWKDRAVVTTAAAFGGGGGVTSNLERFAAQGTTILYGTDFGNARTAGINATELAVLRRAGLSAEAIIAAGTSVPAAYFGFEDLGRIEVGASASFLVLDEDPYEDVTALARPIEVWIDGERR